MKPVRTAMPFATIIAVAATCCGLATAKDLRFPESGSPAFALHIPDDWYADVDQGNLILTLPDKTASVSLSVFKEDARIAAMSSDQLAIAALLASKAEPYNRHETISLGSAKADVYYSRMVNASNIHLLVKLIMVKSVQGSTLTETVLTAEAIRPDQMKSLNAALNGITVIGLK